MNKNRQILKEAISDAKTLRETAIANAKASLEEAFTPQLKTMLSTKLQEMEDEDNKEMDETKGEKSDEFKDIEEVPVDEVKGEKSLDTDSEIEEEPVDEAKETEDDNLDELLDGLDETLEEYGDEHPISTKDALEKPKDETEEEEEKEPVDEAKKDKDEDEEINIDNMSGDDLKGYIEGVIHDMVEKGELESGTEGGEEVSVDEVIKELLGSDDEKEKVDEEKEFKPRFKKTEKNEDTETLAEAMKTIKTLRSSLRETNLLNAKLLYTNKIFRSKSLTEAQKIKVLGAFDKASTAKEAQIVYETIKEGYKPQSNKNRTTVLKENLGGSSRTITTAKTNQPIVVDDVADRFRKIAKLGIYKINKN